MTDPIDRQDAIRIVDGIDTWQAGWRGDAIESLKALPSAQPYTDEEVQKMQDLEQAEVEKAFELGREDGKTEIIHCRDCKHWLPHYQLGFDEDNNEYHDYCKKLIPEDEYYAFYRNADDFCSRAERKNDDAV